ncbi:hypothetical protein [Cutibacterium avidum]|uniref:hypothetical protein n=1 Tax=Cutibacterium avidum TaxID=33010 RepID=UPI002FEEBEAE
MASGDTGLRRVRFSVPPADVSVGSWLDAQYSISESLRALIRDAIRRDGIVDVINRPVRQEPRRGRPPRIGNEPADQVVESAVGDAKPVAESATPSAPAVESEHASTPAPAPAPASPPLPPASEPSDESILDEDGQVDINALMAGAYGRNTRNTRSASGTAG